MEVGIPVFQSRRKMKNKSRSWKSVFPNRRKTEGTRIHAFHWSLVSNAPRISSATKIFEYSGLEFFFLRSCWSIISSLPFVSSKQ